jgi:hypothetical protein
MKFKLLISFILFLNVHSFSQQAQTVTLGADYLNHVFYSLSASATIKSNLNSEWDLAFQTKTAFSTSILINSALGHELYEYPGDTSDWSTLDTTGMVAGWPKRFNSDTSWNYGAFSQNQTGFNIGWGEYNQVTHQIIGNKLFVIKFNSGVYQKIWIERLIGGVYSFRHATLNNSMDMQHSLDKADFANKSFGYFSLTNHIKKDLEPLSSEWDLFFGKYTAFVPTPYGVVGVLQSSQTEASKAYPISTPSTYMDWQAHIMSHAINTIGFDWKTFNFSSNQYDIADSTVYFVRTQQGDVWKIVFDSFSGKSTGDITFNKTQVHYAGLEVKNSLSLFDIYPNPVSDVLTVAYHASEGAFLELVDLSGKTVLNSRLAQHSLTHNLDVSDLKSGLYLLNLTSGNDRLTKRVLIK